MKGRTMNEATVNITDVVKAASRGPVELVEVGDLVFGSFGQTSKVIRVRVGKKTTSIYSEDLWPLTLDNGTIVTTINHD